MEVQTGMLSRLASKGCHQVMLSRALTITGVPGSRESHPDRWNNMCKIRERGLRTAQFSICLELMGSVGVGGGAEQQDLRDEQGPDQSQGKEFALYLKAMRNDVRV